MEVVPAEAGPVEVVPVEAGPMEVAPAEAGPMEVAPVEAGPVEVAPAEAGPMEVVPAEAGPVEVAPVEAVPMEAVPAEAGPMADGSVDGPAAADEPITGAEPPRAVVGELDLASDVDGVPSLDATGRLASDSSAGGALDERDPTETGEMGRPAVSEMANLFASGFGPSPEPTDANGAIGPRPDAPPAAAASGRSPSGAAAAALDDAGASESTALNTAAAGRAPAAGPIGAAGEADASASPTELDQTDDEAEEAEWERRLAEARRDLPPRAPSASRSPEPLESFGSPLNAVPGRLASAVEPLGSPLNRIPRRSVESSEPPRPSGTGGGRVEPGASLEAGVGIGAEQLRPSALAFSADADHAMGRGESVASPSDVRPGQAVEPHLRTGESEPSDLQPSDPQPSGSGPSWSPSEVLESSEDSLDPAAAVEAAAAVVRAEATEGEQAESLAPVHRVASLEPEPVVEEPAEAGERPATVDLVQPLAERGEALTHAETTEAATATERKESVMRGEAVALEELDERGEAVA
ncbi:MAG: hypothetical protein B7733_01395, partial [Myxococcales bacterium FL481]